MCPPPSGSSRRTQRRRQRVRANRANRVEAWDAGLLPSQHPESELSRFGNPKSQPDSAQYNPALGVEPQEVVPGQAEPFDWYGAMDAGVGSMPVVAMQPDWELG